MNSNVLPSIIQIKKENLKQLVTEVKETIATDVNMHASAVKNKKFGVADMWNSQKNIRTANSMRRYYTRGF